MAYGKGCAKTCLRLGDCRKPNFKCEISCFSSDYWNGTSGPVVNAGILLIASFMPASCTGSDESERDARAKPSEHGRTDHME